MYICSWNGAIFVQGTFKRWRRKTHKADRNIIIFSFLQKVDPKCLEFMQTSYLVHACILTNVRRQPTRLWLLRDFAESDFTFSLQFDATTGQEATGGYKNGHVCFANILCKDFTFYAKWSCRMAPTKKMKIITYILERTKHSNAIKMEKKNSIPYKHLLPISSKNIWGPPAVKLKYVNTEVIHAERNFCSTWTTITMYKHHYHAFKQSNTITRRLSFPLDDNTTRILHVLHRPDSAHSHTFSLLLVVLFATPWSCCLRFSVHARLAFTTAACCSCRNAPA